MVDKVPGKGHKVMMEERGKLSLSGVRKVQSFDPKEIVLETVLGVLSIKGEQLGIKQLDLQSGSIEIEGRIDAMVYPKNQDGTRQSLLSRIFK